MIKRLAVLTVALGMVSAQASEQKDLEKYLSIGSVQTEVTTITQQGEFTSVMEQEVAPGLQLADLPGMPVEGVVSADKANIGQVIAVANEVIALGEKIYEIVKKGKPVVNLNYAPISVLPKLPNGQAAEAMDLEGWSLPLARKVRMTYKNLYGMNVVSFDYTIMFAYGGSQDGKGAFITAAQVVPTDVSVAWGYTLNATMKLVGLQNHGTKASPVAGAVVSLNYRVETVLKTIDTTDTYHMTGKGQLREL